MSWFEIRMLLKEREMPGIPADLVAAIEAKTVYRRAWWQSDAFRLRWVPALVALATAFSALWLSRIQKHPDPRAVIPMAARPEPAKVTLHAFLLPNEVADTEKGESREHSKS
jgi:hypothetical protein